MPSCEKCWRDSGGDPQEYARLIQERSCTPEQQAGADATECPVCHKMTIHQYAGRCMNPDCDGR